MQTDEIFARYGIKKLESDGNPPTVVVGMSGGVDSSVSAAILKWQGYNVICLFMKNWNEQDADGVCTSEADYSDVKRAAEVIGIPYYTVNFSKEYMDNVFNVFLEGLKKGITPNPDVLCNREIKFGPFLEHADKVGADYIATGHFCRTARNGDGTVKLLKGVDETKDQSYFLCALKSEQLKRVLFPVGDLTKVQVREIASALGLPNAQKKDSTGICFIGERRFREFIRGYLGNKPGDIKTLGGETVGRHEGLMYYTLGQRKGMGLGGTRGGADGRTDRWFVVLKDLENNILYVNNGECPEMFRKEVIVSNFNWIQPLDREHSAASIGNASVRTIACAAKVRYRQPDQKCTAEVYGQGQVKLIFEKPQRSVTPGQWAVLYDGEICLGGGEIS